MAFISIHVQREYTLMIIVDASLDGLKEYLTMLSSGTMASSLSCNKVVRPARFTTRSMLIIRLYFLESFDPSGS